MTVMRGRKPKPTYMRVLDGNAGHRPINTDEPKPEPVPDDEPPPEWLSDDQKEGWRYAMKNAPAGMLSALDRSILVAWVVAEERHADAAQHVSRLGSLVKGKGGVPYQNPYLSIMNKQAQIMMRAAAELGFTPSSRSRVKVTPPKGAGRGNPFADLKELTDD